MQRIDEVDVGGIARAATARAVAASSTNAQEHVLTAAVRGATSRLCSGAVKGLW